MSEPLEANRRLLELAERVHDLLAAQGIPSAMIGALALAAHGFPRLTKDLDLGVCTTRFGDLAAIAKVLEKEGLEPELRFPDAEDPLGGVLRVPVDEEIRLDVVNFLNPLGSGTAWKIAQEAIERAESGLLEGSPLRVVRASHHVALKLDARGFKSRLDVAELLTRRPEILPETREVCGRFGLSEPLEAIAREIGLS